ncbi:MAG: helical backbone metal receptor, partial [Spirochaetales bacterium]|nr:helical backbone metal receptor [Spirochaetales bacterium]
MDHKQTSILSLFVLALFCLAAPLWATGQSEAPSDEQAAAPSDTVVVQEPVRFTDSRGVTVELPETPRRIISLGPNITETVFALNKGDLLVGRTDWCDYPAEVSGIASVGGLQDPNLEALVALNPDLVIASTHVDPEVLSKLESFSIPAVLIYGEESFEGMEDVISGCAALLGAEDRGKELLKDIRSRREAVAA